MQELLEKTILVITVPEYLKYKNPLTINVRAVVAVLITLVRKNIAV